MDKPHRLGNFTMQVMAAMALSSIIALGGCESAEGDDHWDGEDPSDPSRDSIYDFDSGGTGVSQDERLRNEGLRGTSVEHRPTAVDGQS